MSDAWSRARRCIIRTPRRSVLMVLLMTVVFTALVAQSGVRSTMHDVTEAINSNIGAGFTAHGAPAVEQEQAERLARLPEVTRHSLEAETLARPVGTSPVPGTGGIRLDPQFGGDVSVIGTGDSELHPSFQGTLHRIVEGRGVGEGRAEALIHREFAEHNSLTVGSTFTLTHGDAKVSLTVVGIFDGKTDNPSGLPSGASQNQVFVDVASAQGLGAQPTVGRYLTGSADQLPSALRAAERAVPGLTLEDNSAQFAPVLQAILGVKRLLTLLLVGLSIAGGCVLALVSTFWVRGRIREIGILLAVGKSKGTIVAQLALESGVFALLAAFIATVVGQLLSSHLARAVLAQAGGEVLSGVRLTVSTSSVVISLGIGLLVVLAGVALGALPIVSQRPRRILSTMS